MKQTSPKPCRVHRASAGELCFANRGGTALAMGPVRRGSPTALEGTDPGWSEYLENQTGDSVAPRQGWRGAGGAQVDAQRQVGMPDAACFPKHRPANSRITMQLFQGWQSFHGLPPSPFFGNSQFPRKDPRLQYSRRPSLVCVHRDADARELVATRCVPGGMLRVMTRASRKQQPTALARSEDNGHNAVHENPPGSARASGRHPTTRPTAVPEPVGLATTPT
jgi:hypothetical protein